MSFDVRQLRDTVTIADGAWSTQLHQRGFPADVAAETANLTHPDLVLELAQAYLAAGACLLTTNTFAANSFHLRRRGIHTPVAVLNRAGAELARSAAAGWNTPVCIAGAIGPSGQLMAVREAPPEALSAAFSEQAQALAEGGADLLILETFSETAEILLALQAIKRATGLPVIASMSFCAGPQHTRTVMGAEAGDCAAALEDAGADGVGCNCGDGVEHVLPAVVALRAATTLPLWVKPNAGMPELEDGRAVWRQTPEQFVGHAPLLVEAGANIIGGCCGTGPEHIQRLAMLLQRRRGQCPS